MANEDFYGMIAQRASCRSYKPDPIPEEILQRILSAACKSPSGGGFQTLSIVVIDDAEKRKKLVKMSRRQGFIATAPVSLVFCIDYHRMAQVIEKEPAPFHETDELKNFWMSLIDVGIMAQTAVLAAEKEGLKSCYNGNIINVVDQMTELLQLPDKVIPAIMLTLGYPKIERHQPPKYSTDVLVHRNTYEEHPVEELYKAYRKQNNYQKFRLKPEWIDACCTMAEHLQGPDYAKKVREDIEDKGYIGPYQFWFGCYYQDEPEFLTQADYFEYFRRQGFHWLDEKRKINKENTCNA